MMPTQPSGYGPSAVVMQQPTAHHPAPGPYGQPMEMIPPMAPVAPSTSASYGAGGWQLPSTTCPPGLEFLLPLDRIFMVQKVEGWEVATGFDCKNKYKILDPNGVQIYALKEDSGWLGRAIFGNSRRFTMRIIDRNGREAIKLQRPLQFIGDSVDVYSGEMLLGSVTKEICTCVPEFGVHDAAGRTVLRISGPFCMCGFNHEFTIYSTSQDCAVGEIKKQWSGALREMFSNADTFGFNFPRDLDVKVKGLLLAAAILIDFAYFEDN